MKVPPSPEDLVDGDEKVLLTNTLENTLVFFSLKREYFRVLPVRRNEIEVVCMSTLI